MDRLRVSRKSEKLVTLRVFKPEVLNKVKSLIDATIDANYGYYRLSLSIIGRITFTLKVVFSARLELDSLLLLN